MNHISSLITPDTILLDLSFSSKRHLFEHAGNIFAQRHHLKATDIFNSLSERERLGSTALGYGIAIPHGRIKGLNQAAGMLYRLQTPLEFDAPDAKPVTLCFLLLVPKEADEKHLQILGKGRINQLFETDPMARLNVLGGYREMINQGIVEEFRTKDGQ